MILVMISEVEIASMRPDRGAGSLTPPARARLMHFAMVLGDLGDFRRGHCFADGEHLAAVRRRE